MFSDHFLLYHKNKVFIDSELLPAGTLACMALDLPKETVSYLDSLYRAQKKGGSTVDLREALYSLDCVRAASDLLPNDCSELLDQLVCFRVYIRHFLQKYDTSDCALAWESFLEKLDDLVAQVRNMDNYARTVLVPHIESATVSFESRGGLLCEKVQLSYIDLLLFDLLRSMEYGHPPRLCPCCGGWFIPSRTDEVYCSRPAPEANGRTCREVGAARAFSRKADESLPLGLCRAACSRIYTRKNRGQLTAEEANALTGECRRLRDMALSGEISAAQLEEKLLEVSPGKKKSAPKE